jgi:hypothetical protein
MSKLLSIAIPTYEMRGKGVEYLEHSFQILNNQTFKDFEIVISDHSKNNDIKLICEKWKNILDIKYYHNTKDVGSSSSNINNAIMNSKGEWIKILFQDDFLYNDHSLENTYKTINENLEKKWFVSCSEHSKDGFTFYRPFYPKWSDKMIYGDNSISSPSVIVIKNEDSKLLFDKNYIWLMDCDYYQRYFNKFGLPTIIPFITVVNRTWDNQLTNTISNDVKQNEHYQILKKYKII